MAVIVTIWRHGEAGSALSDRRRELTRRGRDEVSRGGRQFQGACAGAAIAQPDLVLFSPWVRTTQTAAILAATFPGAELCKRAELRPDSDVGAADGVLAELAALAQAPAHVVLVSHQPLVSHLVDYYLGDGTAGPRMAGPRMAGPTPQVPILAPGGLTTLALEVVAQACGELLFWALPPTYQVSR